MESGKGDELEAQIDIPFVPPPSELPVKKSRRRRRKEVEIGAGGCQLNGVTLVVQTDIEPLLLASTKAHFQPYLTYTENTHY